MSQPPGGNSPRSNGIAARYVKVKSMGRRRFDLGKKRRVHNRPDTRLRLGRAKTSPRARVRRWGVFFRKQRDARR